MQAAKPLNKSFQTKQLNRTNNPPKAINTLQKQLSIKFIFDLFKIIVYIVIKNKSEGSMGRKHKVNKLFGDDYGKNISLRISTDDYNYLMGVGKARKIRKSEMFRTAISGYISELKEIENTYDVE